MARATWPQWKKVAAELTDLPKLIRLLNQRMESLSEWVTSSVPMEGSIAIPSAGRFVAGYYVENTGAPLVLGLAGSQYIVKGWKRLTTGSAHVLNVDWVECRTLTGT